MRLGVFTCKFYQAITGIREENVGGVVASESRSDSFTNLRDLQEIANLRNLPLDVFALQFSVCRDYDLQEKILGYSGWQSDPMIFRTLIDGIQRNQDHM